jgi:predicted site-specific integrase-resolvase
MTVTTDEAATIADVSTATIRGWVLKGWLTPVRRGAKPLRFEYDEVARCQREHRPTTWRARHAEAVERWASSTSAENVQR